MSANSAKLPSIFAAPEEGVGAATDPVTDALAPGDALGLPSHIAL
jgi:hypothetical protein